MDWVYAIGFFSQARSITIRSPRRSLCNRIRSRGIQCKALCDIGGQVSVLSSNIYDKVQDHNLDLVPTSTKLIMGDGRTIKPLYIACNLNVIISEKCIPTDFFIIDAHYDKHDHIILGRPFLKLVV
jgi:hypothetical protein